MVLIFAVGESVTHVLVSSMAKAELVKNCNLGSFFQCDKKSSLIPRVRTFVATIASTLGLALLSISCICAYVVL